MTIESKSSSFLKAEDIGKSYGGIKVLEGINIEIQPGEIHGLVGANGAGKSTFIKILSGSVKQDEGSVAIDGQKVNIESPHDALELGLGFIYQDINMVLTFSALENMTMGISKSNKLGLLNWKMLRKKALQIAEDLGFDFSLDQPVKDLSLADRTLISIARALMIDARLIAFDEPTASLSDKETKRIFDIIKKLSDQKIAIIYVSHRLEEIQLLCDRVTIFRDGKKVNTLEQGDITRDNLVDSIVGHKLVDIPVSNKKHPRKEGQPLLDVKHLSGQGVEDVSFELYPGEVLGFGGLVGAGRTELMRMLFGLDKYRNGSILLNGSQVRIKNTSEMIKQGIAMIPEDRRNQGLVMNRGIPYNINLTDLKNVRALAGLPIVSQKKATLRGKDMIKRLQIKTGGNLNNPVNSLSGGNQQKVVIGKWLIKDPRILIMDEPTAGVDVGAREEIYKTIWNLADNDRGVIVVSSDPDELVKICSRVIVMAEGSIQGELNPPLTKEDILHLSFADQSIKEV